jgi:hypothetical protein
MVCSSPAADASSAGSAVRNDMCSSYGKQPDPEAGRDYRGALVLPMQSPWTALRTACFTGYAHRKMAEPIATPDQKQLLLVSPYRQVSHG